MKKDKQIQEEEKPEKKQEEKKEKGMFDKFFNKDKLKKINKVAVIFLRENGLVTFKEVETKDEEFNIEGQKYHVDRDCIYTTEKDRIPLAIIREWDLIPLGTKKWYDTEGTDEDMREKFTQLERHVLRGIKNFELWKSTTSQGSNFSIKQMVLWIIVAFVLGAILIGYL